MTGLHAGCRGRADSYLWLRRRQPSDLGLQRQTNYDFTEAGRPKTTDVRSNSGGTTLQSYKYDYTRTFTRELPNLPAVGLTMESKQLQKRIADGTDVDDATTNYDYDEGRIASARVDGLPVFAYTHEAVGNVTSEASTGGTTYFGYDRAGQLCWRGDSDGDKLNTTCQNGPSGSTSFNHDAAGNNTNLASNPTVYNDDSQVATIDGVVASAFATPFSAGTTLPLAAGGLAFATLSAVDCF